MEKKLLLDMLNDGGAMERILLNKFVDYVEKQIMSSNEQEYIQDNRGIYPKDLILNSFTRR